MDKKRKCLLITALALLVAFMGVMMAQDVQDTKLDTPATQCTNSTFLQNLNGTSTVCSVVPFQTTLTYFFTNETSLNTINFSKRMLITPNATETIITYASLTDGESLQNFTTLKGTPNISFIPGGQYDVHIHAKTDKAGFVMIYANVWETNSTGGLLHLISTTEHETLTELEAEYDMHFFMNSTYFMNSTDSRLQVEIIPHILQDAPGMTLYFGGSTDSHFQFPSSDVDVTNFVPYTGSVADVNLGTHNITANNISLSNGVSIGILESGKVNKTGDTMTGLLCFNNCSQATNGELLVVQKSGASATQGAFIRLESNNTVLGNAFFGARYRGDRVDNQTPVLKNDMLFHLGGIGTKSNNTFSGFVAELRFIAEDNFSSTKTPGRIEFWTVNNITTTSNTKKWEIAANGSFIPANNNQFDIGNDTSKVKNLSIALTAEGSTLDAVCYDGTKLFYNPGVATCTASHEGFKHNITPAIYDPMELKRFQLITYDYIVQYPHVDEVKGSVSYTEKTVKRYGLTAEQVEAIDPLLVGHDEFGNPTGIHYEDLAAYLLNVTQAQQEKIDKICGRQPALCQ